MKVNASAALVLAILALASGCAPKKPTASNPGMASLAAATTRGSVVFFEGDVKIDGTAAEIGRALGPKVDVETGPAAYCDIVFDGKNAIRVGGNSSAILDFSGIVKEVSLRKGGLSAVLRKLGHVSGADSFRVSTATAVAGVRGTSFCVWANDNSTYVCACNGTVRTVDAKGSNEMTIAAAHHSARNYVRAGSAIQVSPAGMEYHDDASIESLAARIGEKIDWTKED